jgi:hypothetical protein
MRAVSHQSLRIAPELYEAAESVQPKREALAAFIDTCSASGTWSTAKVFMGLVPLAGSF